VHQRETALSLELHSGTPRLEGSLTAATDYVCLECRRTASCDRYNRDMNARGGAAASSSNKFR
jgi:hypothetical protein